MTMTEKADELLASAKAVKEKTVKKSGGKDIEIPHLVHAVRGDRIVACSMAHPSRDNLLELAYRSAYGFSADILVLTFETLGTTYELNPLTNGPWEEGDLQFLASKEGGREKGWVQDRITVTAVDRDGNHYFATLGYKIEDGQVVWDEDNFVRATTEEEEGPDPISFSGFMYESLNEVMKQETLSERVQGEYEAQPLVQIFLDKYKADEDGQERLEIQQDIATLRMLTELHLIFACSLEAEQGSTRAALLDELMPRLKEEQQFAHVLNVHAGETVMIGDGYAEVVPLENTTTP